MYLDIECFIKYFVLFVLISEEKNIYRFKCENNYKTEIVFKKKAMQPQFLP